MNGSVISNDEGKEQEQDLLEHAKREYFQTNPETKPFADLIQFYIQGTTISIDDSKLPADVAALIRKRDGKNTL